MDALKEGSLSSRSAAIQVGVGERGLPSGQLGASHNGQVDAGYVELPERG